MKKDNADNLYIDVANSLKYDITGRNFTKMEFSMIRDSTLENLRNRGITAETYVYEKHVTEIFLITQLEMTDFYKRFRTNENNSPLSYECIFLQN